MKQPAIIHFRLSSPPGSGGFAIDPEGRAGSLLDNLRQRYGNRLTAATVERAEERAGILEFCAGMNRREAERPALAEVTQTETRPTQSTEKKSSQPLENKSMMTVSETQTTAFELPPAGPVAARCCRLIDLGSQESEFQGEKKLQRKILISWELSELRTDGSPFQISRRFGLSLHEKSALRAFLQAWRGRPFSDTELAGFDLRKLLNAPCLLNVVHTERAGKQYANIASISPLPRQMTAPDLSAPTLCFDIDEPDLLKAQGILEGLSDSLQATITGSPEWLARIKEAGQAGRLADSEAFDDDLAF